MPSYLGELGALATIKCPSSLRISEERPATVETTIGGRRYAYLGVRAHREWDVDVSNASPEQVAQLSAFVRGDFGPGPFWWVDAWAAATNVLPPAVASLTVPWQNTTQGGPITLPDGTIAGQSLIVSSSSRPAEPVDDDGETIHFPVKPGVPITASAWLSAASQSVRLLACDAAGTILASSSGSTSTAGLARASATIAEVPAGASYAAFRVNGTGRLVYPTLTWTDAATPYSGGEGAATVIVTADGRTVTRAVPGAVPYGQMADVAFTVTEVGP